GLGEVRGNVVVGADGTEREVDTIILGTGFYVTDSPMGQRVRGADGRSLADVWEGSMQAHRGTTVAGFPNYFNLVGPNTGLGRNTTLWPGFTFRFRQLTKAFDREHYELRPAPAPVREHEKVAA